MHDRTLTVMLSALNWPQRNRYPPTSTPKAIRASTA